MDNEAFNLDLQHFQSSVMAQFELGLSDIKDTLNVKEIKLRNDLYSSIGGFLAYMKDRYGNGVSK